MLVTGTNQQGKTRLAMAISETLQNQGINENWRIIVFDVVGHWKQFSSMPYYVQLKQLRRVKVPEHSIIFDISFLLPSEQKQFVESTLLDLWKSNLEKTPDFWTLCIFEESQLYTRNLRGLLSQQIQRIFSVGANLKIRSLAITPSLTGIDPEFIRLCNQRYHFRLGNEQNIKRKFKSYYGSDWLRVTLNLDVGFFVYYLNGQLEVKHVNLYTAQTKPQPLQLTKPTQPEQPRYIQTDYTGLLGRSLNRVVNWLQIPQDNKPHFARPVTDQDQRDKELDTELDEDLDYLFFVEDL